MSINSLVKDNEGKEMYIEWTMPRISVWNDLSPWDKVQERHPKNRFRDLVRTLLTFQVRFWIVLGRVALSAS